MLELRQHLKVILFFILIVFSQKSLYSQIVATFSSNTTEGCAPLSVSFYPDYQNASTYFWDFGNGNVSDSIIAFAIFNLPGIYTVELTVSEGSNTLSSTMTITVFNDPVAGLGFSGQTNNGCAPSEATFVNQSTLGDAPIVSWFWDFGDGYTTLENSANQVSNNYTFSGDYSVSLEVTDANGCSDDILVPNIVHISALPVVSFYASASMFCEVPAVASFINSSTGFGNLSSTWDFGDGILSSLSNPDHTYSDYGYYDVTLSVTDMNGCVNSVTNDEYIRIDSVRAGFIIPDTVCAMDTFIIQNTSTGASSYMWDWVVGTSSILSPSVAISQGGHFLITLDASLNGICNDIYTESIFIESVLAYYQPDPWYICNLPQAVDFINTSTTNNSQGLLDYLWEFGTNFSPNYVDYSSLESPVVVYDFDDSINTYNHWTFHNLLTVTSPFGCIDEWEDSVVVWLTVPKFSIDQSSSCVPFTVDYEDLSTYTSPYDNIISWAWDFGNGLNYFGQFPPQQLYPDTGFYTPSLVITTQYGCTDTAETYITGGLPQNPSFIMLSPDTICGSDFAIFQSTAQDTSIIHTYSWQYSDQTESIGPYTMTHPYDTGWIDVTHSVTHYGCGVSIFESNVFYAQGPIGWPKVDHFCENPLLYSFNPMYNNGSYWIDYDHFYWDFSDGVPIDSVNQFATHLYTTSPLDTFIYLTLTNDNTGCIVHDSVFIQVRNPIASFTMDTTKICPGDTVHFYPLSSQDYYLHGYAWLLTRFFRWNFDDGTIFGPGPLAFPNNELMPDTISYDTIFHVFNQPGIYDVRLMIYDMYECIDTVVHQVHVFNTSAIPFIDPPSGCTPVECTFSDISVADTTIVSWFWDFGQGDTSILQNPLDTIVYSIDSSYYVVLSITDELGCSNEVVVEVVASTPFAQYTVSNSFICLGDSILFIDSSITYASAPQYIWDFGDGTTSSEVSPTHVYLQGGFYQTSLTIIDGTCVTTDTLPLPIQIQDPYTEIVSSVTGTVCPPEHVLFHTDPHPSYFHQLIWNLGDGTPSSADEPGHNYTVSGTYPVTVKVFTTANCYYLSDTVYLNVIVVEADLGLSDDFICLGENIDLMVQNQLNVDGTFIDFGDGSPFDTSTVVNHTYNIASQFGYLIPTLLYWNDDCAEPKSDFDTLLIKDVRAFFNRGPNDTDTASCYNLTVQFENEAIGASLYDWDFGNNASSQEANPLYTFSTPGDYYVQLTVSGDGCNVTEGKWVHVYPAPDIQVSTFNEICFGDNVQLNAQGGDSYLWMPDTFLTNNIIYNPVSSPPYSIDYILQVTDSMDCVGEETVTVFVQQTPEINLQDTFIIVGQTYDLPDSAGYNIEYFWSPEEGLFLFSGYNPGFHPMDSTTYTVMMYAYANGVLCETDSASFFLDVIWEFTVDVPQVFTPNGDGVNDFVFVRGWGIRRLVDFKIFNRWGELVFQTDDINIGWDGIYKGQLQASDTYIYDVEIETFELKKLKKKGSITLIR